MRKLLKHISTTMFRFTIPTMTYYTRCDVRCYCETPRCRLLADLHMTSQVHFTYKTQRHITGDINPFRRVLISDQVDALLGATVRLSRVPVRVGHRNLFITAVHSDPPDERGLACSPVSSNPRISASS